MKTRSCLQAQLQRWCFFLFGFFLPSFTCLASAVSTLSTVFCLQNGSRNRKKCSSMEQSSLLGSYYQKRFFSFVITTHTARQLPSLVEYEKHWQHLFTSVLLKDEFFFHFFFRSVGWHTTMRTPKSIFWRRRYSGENIPETFQSPHKEVGDSGAEISFTLEAETNKDFSTYSRFFISVHLCERENGERESEKLRWSSCMDVFFFFLLHSWHLWKILEVHSNPLLRVRETFSCLSFERVDTLN